VTGSQRVNTCKEPERRGQCSCIPRVRPLLLITGYCMSGVPFVPELAINGHGPLCTYRMSGHRTRLLQVTPLTPPDQVSNCRQWAPKCAVADGPETVQDAEEPSRRFFFIGSVALGFSAAIVFKRNIINGDMEKLSLPPGLLSGRVIVITGGNTGLGLESAVRLASAGATVVVTARTDDKGLQAVDNIKRTSGSSDVHYVQLDLADLDSVKGFAARFKTQKCGDRIDVLMNNAGVMAIPKREVTKDGFERQFGVNHLGHFALVAGLLPLLRKAQDYARVINVSSAAHLFPTKKTFDGDFLALEKYDQWGSYCESKLANIAFTTELDRRFKESGFKATAVSLHPGTVNTDLNRWFVGGSDDVRIARGIKAGNPFLNALTPVVSREVDLGANTQIYLAAGLDGGYDKSGGNYFDNMKLATQNPLANDRAFAADLWSRSEQLTGVKFDI